MSHAVHDRLQVGSAGEQPGGVGVAQIVDADTEVDAAGFDGGGPGAGTEGVAGDGGAVAGGEQQVVGAEATFADVGGQLVEEAGAQAHGAGFVVFGVGLGDHPLPVGGRAERDYRRWFRTR